MQAEKNGTIRATSARRGHIQNRFEEIATGCDHGPGSRATDNAHVFGREGTLDGTMPGAWQPVRFGSAAHDVLARGLAHQDLLEPVDALLGHGPPPYLSLIHI